MSLNRNQGMWGALCMPAKLYGIVSLFSIAGLLYKQHLVGAISQGLFSAIWLFLLNWICGPAIVVGSVILSTRLFEKFDKPLETTEKQPI